MVLESPVEVGGAVWRNDLAHLQLEIARRADRLMRVATGVRDNDRELWLQAEREVFGRRDDSLVTRG